MKILCPIDFSNASVNAVEYASELFGLDGKGEIEVVHCINMASRASMFVRLDDILREKAEEDMEILINRLALQYRGVNYSTKIMKIDPKYYLPTYAEKNGFDFVVTGTKGMTQLKDITIGSLTEALFENSSVPVLAIPNKLRYKDMQSVVMALDADAIEKDHLLNPLKAILKLDDAKIHLVHVRDEDKVNIEYDPSIDVMLQGFDYDYNALPKTEDDIGKIIRDFVDNKNSDLLVFIHHPRTWWEKLFTRSHTKNELYNIEAPLLVLRD